MKLDTVNHVGKGVFL